MKTRTVFCWAMFALCCISFVAFAGTSIEDKWMGTTSKVIGTGGAAKTIHHYVLPTKADTCGPFDTRRCDRITIAGGMSGDSLSYCVDWSLDGDKSNTGVWSGVWWNIVDTTYVNGTPTATGPSDETVWSWEFTKQLEHLPGAITSGTRVIVFDAWTLPKVRVRIGYSDKSDTLCNGRIRLLCGE